MKTIAIVNGANLNLLGSREIDIYGTQSFESFFETLKMTYSHLQLIYFQSNKEEDLINFLHQHSNLDGIILNPGAFSHTSLAIADAIRSIAAPVIEVHISQIFTREDFRKHSWITSACTGSICGFGLNSYRLALEYFK